LVQILNSDTFFANNFEFDRVLSEDSENRKITILVTAKNNNGKAIIVVMKKNFDSSNARDILDKLVMIQITQTNNQYLQTDASLLEPKMNELMLTIIYPATPAQIEKNSAQNSFLVRETSQDFKTITSPYIDTIPTSEINWIQDIINHTKEKERILGEDTDPDVGFILLPGYNWDQKNTNFLSCLAIAIRGDVRCVRDLRAKHIPLLENLKKKSLQIIQTKYAVGPTQLRVFVHYMPSFFHFHVHFYHVNCSSSTGKDILLDDIIDNINMDDKHYEKVSLTCVLKEHNPIGKLYFKSSKV